MTWKRWHARCGPTTRIVFVANPNNPTGTYVPGGVLEAFVAGLPQQVLVVLDEAYNEYLRPEHRYDSIAWLKKYPNLLITRTFSKVYGLAGLRVGYAMGRAGRGRPDEPRAPAVQRQQPVSRCRGSGAG